MGTGKLWSVSLVMALGFAQVAAADSLRVKTKSGTVEGALTPDGKVVAFKGIPFAAPPVGDLRWKEPQPAVPWKGVRDAKTFGSHCVQTGQSSDMLFRDPGPSEDCLTVNVWTPAGAKPKSLPVMVWIYGGGFASGGSSEGRQDGQFLAHRNVVVVSMNYRMGIWGFLVHPELTAESPHHASGNYGLLDIAAAIRWVKENVAEFGGDPGNLTIFGESAGSFAVSAEMASPVARGMINKAIGESGGAFSAATLGFAPRAERETRDSAFAKTAFATDSLAELRKLSTEELVTAVSLKTTPPVPRFGPVVDGYFLPEPVPAIYAAGQQAHIPLLAGWNADEGSRAAKPTVEAYTAQARKEFGDQADAFLAVYPGTTEDEARVSAGDLARDRFIAFGTWRWIEAHAKTGQTPIFRYFFDYGSPGDRYHAASAGAFHSDEIHYVFGTLDLRPEAHWRPEDRALSDLMGQYWTNFARNGDPNGPGLPQWPGYSAAGGWQVMHLDPAAAAKPDEGRPRYLFLDGAWPK